jgi:uncharacterized protein (DUF362 family)
MTSSIPTHDVFIRRTQGTDYGQPPFHPDQAYPELSPDTPLSPENEIYGAVRDLLVDFGFDAEHHGTAAWNPFKGFVEPGQTVFIKPNLVFHKHSLGEEGIVSMLSQGAVIRPLIDYVWKALDGKGEILIGDVPLQSAEWDLIMKYTGLRELIEAMKSEGVDITLYDLRLEHAITTSHGLIVKRVAHREDPLGYQAVNIGTDSLLMSVIDQHDKFTITDYPQGTVSKHHNETVNEYLIPKSILAADVFINVPKMKTHKKAGVTLSMKNLIGINADKSWIAHHREGPPEKGGDEFPHMSSKDLFKYRLYVGLKNNWFGVQILRVLLPLLHGLAKIQRWLRPQRKASVVQFESISEGSWYGNDTLWRVIGDLNRIILYADKEGKLHPKPQRRYLSVIDGVLGGERNGPMHHMPKAGCRLMAGFNPVVVDLVTAHSMGMDFKKIPQIHKNLGEMKYQLVHQPADEIQVHDQGKVEAFVQWKQRPTDAFLAATSWEGHIEHDHRDEANQTDLNHIPKALEIGGE